MGREWRQVMKGRNKLGNGGGGRREMLRIVEAGRNIGRGREGEI